MVFTLALAFSMPLLNHIRHLFDTIIANENSKPAYEGKIVYLGILRRLYVAIEDILGLHTCVVRNELPYRMNRPTTTPRYTPYGQRYNNKQFYKTKYRY
jgi:hypothetical protein